MLCEYELKTGGEGKVSQGCASRRSLINPASTWLIKSLSLAVLHPSSQI